MDNLRRGIQTRSIRGALRSQWVQREVAVTDEMYRSLEKAPPTLVDEAGNYRPGWFEESPKDLNLASLGTALKRFHRWFFIHFDTKDYFVGANLIDLFHGGNAGVVFLDKESGEFKVESDSALFFMNGVEIDSSCRRFTDKRSGSRLEISDDDRRLEFDIRCKTMHLRGVAEEIFARPFIQSTAFHSGHGALQSWGNLRLAEGELKVGRRWISIDGGTLGAYDRSLGHRRPLENWNWIASCGRVKAAETGKEELFALHAARDRSFAQPQVEARKYSLWLGDAHLKLADLRFEYLYSDRSKRKTGEWTISSPRRPGYPSLNLKFIPRYQRRDAHRIPCVFNVDHSQYFGELSGDVYLNDKRYVVSDVFATTEDSMMIV